jgi:hypothetical protein
MFRTMLSCPQKDVLFYLQTRLLLHVALFKVSVRNELSNSKPTKSCRSPSSRRYSLSPNELLLHVALLKVNV